MDRGEEETRYEGEMVDEESELVLICARSAPPGTQARNRT